MSEQEINIEVLLKKVYGKELFYPKNDIAKAICYLLDSKTITKNQLILCKEFGWKVSVVQEEYVLE